MEKSVRVIIVSYNSGQYLARCLSALAGQSYKNFEAIIVDNASTDGVEIDTLLPDERFQLMQMSENLGFAKANNIGAQGAETDWICLLNPDAFPVSDWLEQILAFSLDNPQYEMLGSTQLMADDPSIYDGTGDFLSIWGLAWRGLHGYPVKGPHPSGEVFAPCAAASFYKRHLFEAVQGLDNDFFCYMEDVDLGFRMRHHGARAWQVGDAVVHHVSSGISGRGSEFAVYHGMRNMTWMITKNVPLLFLPVVLALNLCAQLAACCTRHRARRKTILRALKDAYRGLPKMMGKRAHIELTSRQFLSLVSFNPKSFMHKHTPYFNKKC